jgi:hypothetical protein
LATVGASALKIVSYESGLDWGDSGPDPIQDYLYSAISTDARMEAHYATYYYPPFATAGQTGIINHYSSVAQVGTNGLYPFRYGIFNSVIGKELGLKDFIAANPKTSLPYLLNRDLDPASNDNSPKWLDKAA